MTPETIAVLLSIQLRNSKLDISITDGTGYGCEGHLESAINTLNFDQLIMPNPFARAINSNSKDWRIDWQLTAKGQFFIEMLGKTPLPSFVDPRETGQV